MKNQIALIGQWTLERQIQSTEGNGAFTGMCEFTSLDDNRLLCNETGVMHMNGNETAANRSYIYAYQDNSIVIFYNDPHRKDEILHELNFETDGETRIAKHCHLCGNDTYDLTFTILSDDHITMQYVVKGPHKNYAMQSVLTRAL